MADEVRWEDPPSANRSANRRKRQWEPRLLPLMEQPKRWAVVRTYPTAKQAYDAVGNLRGAGYRRYLPSGRWEFTSRTVDGEYRLYARYLGPEDE